MGAKKYAFVSMTGDQPLAHVKQIMNEALASDLPEERPKIGPFITPDTRIIPITTSLRCKQLIEEYLGCGWVVFVQKEEDLPPVMRDLIGLYLFRVRNGMTEVHKVLSPGKTLKVYPGRL